MFFLHPPCNSPRAMQRFCGPSCGLAVLRLRLKSFPTPHSVRKTQPGHCPRASVRMAWYFRSQSTPYIPLLTPSPPVVTTPPVNLPYLAVTSSPPRPPPLHLQTSDNPPSDWPPTSPPQRLRLFTSCSSCLLPLKANHFLQSPGTVCFMPLNSFP